jgi:putative ABC transport system ATP-binding protein
MKYYGGYEFKMEYVISTENVWKTYTSGIRVIHAINDLTVKIPIGKKTCVTGPSGSGKSTMLNLLGLITNPTKGEIYLEGAPVQRMSDIFMTKLRREKFGFIFQSQYLLPHLNALENARLPLLAHNITMDDATTRTMEVLEQLEIAERASSKIQKLSGGQAQRINIARALVTKPEILIADEPSSSIDSRLTEEFLQIIDEYQSKWNITVIMASHDPMIINRNDQVINLKDGKVTTI